MPSERTLRLTTGLVLYAYAGCHFLSHATGLFHLETMESLGRGVFLAPWRTWVGQSLLFGALFVHGGLGLKALIRRRHLRMPALEAWQLGLGLLIPLLLIPHAANVRLGHALYGFDDSYYRIVYQYWITTPLFGLSRQFFLLVAVWVHGSIGMHMFLRFRPWYRRCLPALAGLAIALPFLAILGIVSAGWDATLRSAVTPGFSERNGPGAPGTSAAGDHADLETLWDELRIAYLALILGALAFRALQHRRELRLGRIKVHYPDRRAVVVPRGFSVLEASRWAGIPHTSICGGRGRCSTCRIKVTSGYLDLPKPSESELATLERVRAPDRVRLACQLRPRDDIGVVPLISSRRQSRGLHIDFDEGRELLVTALSVDLRDSTTLAAGRLPFDSLYIVDRYVQCVSGAIEEHGGYVTSVAGDGVMSVFGVGGDAVAGARGALAAARSIWDGVERLSEDLAEDLRAPLRCGIGVHSGPSVVGSIVLSGGPSLQFLGDTGNVAARLEGLNKDLSSTLIVSEASFIAAKVTPPADLERTEIVVRGRDIAPLQIVVIRDKRELRSIDLEYKTYSTDRSLRLE